MLESGLRYKPACAGLLHATGFLGQSPGLSDRYMGSNSTGAHNRKGHHRHTSSLACSVLATGYTTHTNSRNTFDYRPVTSISNG